MVIFFFEFLFNLIRLIKKLFKTKKKKFKKFFFIFKIKIKIKIEELKFFCFNFLSIEILT